MIDDSPYKASLWQTYLNDKALVTLLIEKGVFTETEYFKALATTALEEKAAYEDKLSKLTGKKVVLG